MQVNNLTSADIYFGPLRLPANATGYYVDDTTATSLYLTSDVVADALNNAYAANKIQVSGQAQPFPRPTGTPQILHGDGDPEGLVFAPQGSAFLRRDGLQSNGGVIYVKTTGVTLSTGWLDLPDAAGVTVQLPPGSLVAYAAATAPTGWLLCDGSAVSRTVYQLLFVAIGTTYGAGDGSTTFNVPDMRGRIPVGYAASGGHSDVSTLANTDGSALANRRPRHQHTIYDPGHNHTYQIGDVAGTPYTDAYFDNNPQRNINTSTNTTGIKVNPEGAASSSSPQDAPAYLVVNYIIKT